MQLNTTELILEICSLYIHDNKAEIIFFDECYCFELIVSVDDDYYKFCDSIIDKENKMKLTISDEINSYPIQIYHVEDEEDNFQTCYLIKIEKYDL